MRRLLQRPPLFPYTTLFRSVICIERPGTGISTPYVYDSVLDYAADVADFADVLGIDRFGVAGLSGGGDRKSTRLNSSYSSRSYAVLCLKKKHRNRRARECRE